VDSPQADAAQTPGSSLARATPRDESDKAREGVQQAAFSHLTPTATILLNLSHDSSRATNPSPSRTQLDRSDTFRWIIHEQAAVFKTTRNTFAADCGQGRQGQRKICRMSWSWMGGAAAA
jgi:hypothetical protein